MPWTPRGVEFVCVSPPGNQVVKFPFIDQELLPERKSFIAGDLWEEREGFTRRRQTAKEEQLRVALLPGRTQEAQFSGHPAPTLPGATPQVARQRKPHVKMILESGGPLRLMAEGASCLCTWLAGGGEAPRGWGLTCAVRGVHGEEGAQEPRALPLHS